MVRNIIHVSLGVIAPAVVGAPNRVSFDMLATDFRNNEHRTGVLGQVRTHVLTVCIEHDRIAALPAIQGEVATEEGHANGAAINFPALGDDKPASRVGVGSQTIICCLCHDISPVVLLCHYAGGGFS